MEGATRHGWRGRGVAYKTGRTDAYVCTTNKAIILDIIYCTVGG